MSTCDESRLAVDTVKYLAEAHGTALAAILNYYDQRFGFEQYWAIVDRMPYIILMEFKNNSFKSFEALALS